MAGLNDEVDEDGVKDADGFGDGVELFGGGEGGVAEGEEHGGEVVGGEPLRVCLAGALAGLHFGGEERECLCI